MNRKIVFSALRKVIPKGRISLSKKERFLHAKDRSFHTPHMPDIVIWAKNAKEISDIMKVAQLYTIPVTAWGGGSSLQGNPIPVKGGIVIDMTKMNKVLEIFPKGLQVRVQPGIIGDALNNYLKQYNLFFPAFPGSANLATIGGMIANNAGGMYAVKYGVTGDWVQELEVVLANGEIIRVGGRTRKSVSGYDLLPLFIGSEGTLGIITEVIVRLEPIPVEKMACLATFRTIHDAAGAISATLQSSIHPAAFELMDESYVAMVNGAQKQLQMHEFDTLLLELHGTKEQLSEELVQIEKIYKKYRCVTFTKFTTKADCEKLWACRKGIRIAFREKEPHTGILSAEVAVPLDKIAYFIKKTKQLHHKYGIRMLNHGHMGDGNFHTWALYDLHDPESLLQAEQFNDELTRYALEIAGTASGEHGLGLSKQQYLPQEHPTSMPWMLGIKQLFDPQGVLNPGKIFPV
jgi:D-lactate dehydrogenase (cytochrome)